MFSRARQEGESMDNAKKKNPTASKESSDAAFEKPSVAREAHSRRALQGVPQHQDIRSHGETRKEGGEKKALLHVKPTTKHSPLTPKKIPSSFPPLPIDQLCLFQKKHKRKNNLHAIRNSLFSNSASAQLRVHLSVSPGEGARRRSLSQHSSKMRHSPSDAALHMTLSLVKDTSGATSGEGFMTGMGSMLSATRMMVAVTMGTVFHRVVFFFFGSEGSR